MPAALAHLLFAAALWLGLGWATSSHAQEAGAAKTLPTWTVTIKDGVFTPKQLEVPAGKRIKLIVKNAGPGPLEFENPDLHIEKILAANAESFVVITLPPGEHLFVDEFNFVTGELRVLAK